MKISEKFKNQTPAFSFEFFPPKTDEDVALLMDTAQTLKALGPAYISVTWGAGGSTRRKTIDIVCAIKEKLGVETMAHLTCVGAGRGELSTALDELKARGIDNVLALRGDPPKGQTQFQPHPDGFRYANELVAHIRSRWPFCLAVAGYPEGHVETPDLAKDMDNLKRKVDAGADIVITQLFFDNDDFLRFRDRAGRAGIHVPLVPGIMPVTNFSQLQRFTALCGAKIPPALARILEPLQADKDAVVRLGIDHATRQCAALLQAGVPGIHFYTLNRSHSTVEILKNLQGARRATEQQNL